MIIERSGDETQDIEAVINIANQNQVEKIIAGLPRSMNGAIGRQAEKVKSFVQILSGHTQVPIEFRDERLTSVMAKRLMKAGGKRKTGKRRKDDAVAAAIILQGYLDEEREV